MPQFSDRVQETTTTTGTGSITLAGAVTGFRSFSSAFNAAAAAVEYTITDGTDWEVGKGTYDGSTTLTRDLVRASSNSGALVNFSAGTKNVWVDVAAKTITNANLGHQIAVSSRNFLI